MDHGFVIRDFVDERKYHNTAILIYLKAVNEVMGNINVRIGNSLNQGYFTYTDVHLTPTDINKIRRRMESLIAKDIEIVAEHPTMQRAMDKWASLGFKEKARLLIGQDPDDTIEIANLDGYRNCMYTKVLPSTGC